MTQFIKPNLYDKMIINNGCGPTWLKSKISTKSFLDFIFAPACMNHDTRYSKYCEVTRKDADEKFYKDMIKLIKKGNYNWYKRWSYTLIAKDYYRLVRWYGKASFSEYDISAIFPSFSPYKNDKLRIMKIETVFINKIERWYVRSEAIELGLIK